MSDSQTKQIFDRAIEIPSPNEREKYLEQMCDSDLELRSRVDELIQAYHKSGSFLEDANLTIEATSSSVAEREGTEIGPYKLLQRIGEGGFGVVYMAEQHKPVRRKVALKIIKPGMDTKEVIARFEAERQALALMDHPNIARVLDAGETESGRPFFAMELIKGVPLTEFCDTNKLTGRERLELFVTVCRAMTSERLLADFEIPENSDDNYGGRATGLLSPPETGEYVFYIASDDSSELYLSTSDLPNDKRLLASLQGWAPPRGWSRIGPSSISDPIRLQRGRRYWVEVLFKEGSSGDNMSVTWRRAGEPKPEDGAGPIEGQYLGHYPW